MLPQGVLDFQYEAERSNHGQTGLAGLPLYLDLIRQSGLTAAIRRYVCVAGRQGWLDLQMVLAVLFLNLAGGDCVEDLERLEADRMRQNSFGESVRRHAEELGRFRTLE